MIHYQRAVFENVRLIEPLPAASINPIDALTLPFETVETRIYWIISSTLSGLRSLNLV
jgi:hypothetical protein